MIFFRVLISVAEQKKPLLHKGFFITKNLMGDKMGCRLYILKSKSADKYYLGISQNPER